jgi:hypothetical protein
MIETVMYFAATGQLEEITMLDELMATLNVKLEAVRESQDAYETEKAEARALIDQITQQLQQIAESL